MLREFTFGHVRQLDRASELALTRAWAAGAGPGDASMFIDLGSTICDVHGYAKQGAAYGYTRVLGYHPLVATRADTGEGLHARMRKGLAGSGRGTGPFVRELVGRVRRAGPTGKLTIRGNSGFWSHKVMDACVDHDVDFSSPWPVRSRSWLRSRALMTLRGSTSTTPPGVSPRSPRPSSGSTG